MITVEFTEAEAQALADLGKVKKTNPGQVIELCDTKDHQPRAAIYVYGNGEKLTEEDENKIADSIDFNPTVIYIDYANARKLANQLLEAARMITSAA
jgi:hypothetical protein